MKLSREFWVLATALLVAFAPFWLFAHIPVDQFRQFEERAPWFPLALGLVSISFWVPSLAKGRHSIWHFIKAHPISAFTWLCFWLAVFFLLFLHYAQQSFSRFQPSFTITFGMIFLTAYATVMVGQNWESEKRITWLSIAGLSYIAAGVFIYATTLGR